MGKAPDKAVCINRPPVFMPEQDRHIGIVQNKKVAFLADGPGQDIIFPVVSFPRRKIGFFVFFPRAEQGMETKEAFFRGKPHDLPPPRPEHIVDDSINRI